MAVGKEIRGKIKSVENTKKITKAMEMVAASKMRKAQERMRAARPYSEKVRNIATHLGQANPEYVHPFMKIHDAKATGYIVVTTDKGLCGGMTTHILRALTHQFKDLQAAGATPQTVAIGNKGLGFLNRVGAPVLAHVTQLGDTPHLEKLIGAVKVMMDAYTEGKLDAVYLCYTKFINTMKQEPVIEQLLPLSDHKMRTETRAAGSYAWDYLYEPDAPTVIDDLLELYIESLVYQADAGQLTWPGMNASRLANFASQLTENCAATLLRFLLLQVQGLAEAKEVCQQLKTLTSSVPSPDSETLQGGLAILNTADLRDVVAELTKPVLLVLGAKDALVPIALGQAMLQLQPNLRVCYLAGSAHAPFLSQCEETVGAISHFLHSL